MAKCDKCYHAGVCLHRINYEDYDCECTNYKDKSLIVELPCRVGDVLFTIEYNCDSESSYIEKIKCNSIEIYDCDISIYCETIEGNYDTYIPADFGETVFLSREEAERALEESE